MERVRRVPRDGPVPPPCVGTFLGIQGDSIARGGGGRGALNPAAPDQLVKLEGGWQTKNT